MGDDHLNGAAEADLAIGVDRIALFELALEAAGAMTWVWDIASDHIETAGSATHYVFGIERGTPISGETFLGLAHPDDRRMLIKQIGTSITTGVDYACEYRATRVDGEIRWHSTRGQAIRDASGAIVRLIGVSVDITEQRRVAEALRDSEARVQSVLAGAPIVLLAFDAEGTITLAQGKALGALDVDGSALIGTPVSAIFADDLQVVSAISSVLAGDVVDARAVIDDVVFETSYRPLVDADGSVMGGVVVATDITDRVEAEEELARLALHDPLTGLANRVLFNDRLELHLARSARRRGHTSVLFLDLDGFKAVNDTHGHQVGDALLREVADRLRRTVRPEDTVARFGGDEFLVLGEVAGQLDAETIADRILRSLSEPYDVGGFTVQVGVSIGIAIAAPGSERDLAERATSLIRAADIAMYKAKQAGRGCFRVIDDGAGVVDDEVAAVPAAAR